MPHVLARSAFVLVAAVVLGSCAGSRSVPPAAFFAGPAASKVQVHTDVLQHGPRGRLWLELPFLFAYNTGGDPTGISAGSDGAMWLTTGRALLLARLGMDGTQSQWYILIGSAQFVASSIVLGPDGRLYMGGRYAYQDGSGCSVSLPCPAIVAAANGPYYSYTVLSTGRPPSGLAVGPDHNIWFVTQSIVGNITTSFVETDYSLGGPQSTGHIAAGSDGRVWFDELTAPTDANVIAAIAPSTGAISQYPVSNCRNIGDGLAKAADGNLYIICVHLVGSKTTYALLRISPTGTMHQIPVSGGTPGRLIAGPDGKIWFILSTSPGYSLVRYDPSRGTFTPHALPFTAAVPSALASGPDGNIWITDAHSTGKRTNVYVFIRNRLDVQPASLTLATGAQSTLTAFYSGSLGRSSLSATTSNSAVATVAPSSPPGSFVVKAVASGSATITVTDTIENSFNVAVTVH